MPVQNIIRVLIVDDITDTRENIKRMLQFDSLIEIAGMARSGREAIDLSNQVKPDVIIMDINMPDMDGITATEAIRRKFPYVQVVILSVQNDPNYMRRAMQAGVRDFLTKPPAIEDLLAAIRRAGKMAQDEKSQTSTTSGPATPLTSRRGTGKIVSVYSPKGGTGCTTIATNLAICLHSEENPVVLLEANLLYGDVAVFINEQVKNSVYDLTPRVDELDAEVVHNVAVKHSASGLDVLPAPPKAEWATEITSEQFSKLLDFLRDVYAYIIVDTAPYLTDVVQAALEISDTIVLITTQEIPSIKNCSSFLSLSDASGIKRNRILFIMNRYDKRNNVSPERVGETLRQPIQICIPLDDKAVPISITRGKPFILDNKSLPVSKGIFELADLIQTRFNKQDDALPLTKR